MSFIETAEIQPQTEPLGSYTMNLQENNEEWGCTLTANNDFNSAVVKMTKAFWRRRTRMRMSGMNLINLIQCQEMDDCNNIMLPHTRHGGLERGRLGIRRNK
jgi:hypothetical protein